MANDSDAQANESHAGELAKLIPALILLGRELGPRRVMVPLPWRACARVEGALVTLKVWPAAVPEPRWDDPKHTGTVRLPDGWEYPGRAGWYVGHLEPGATAGFAVIQTAARPLSGR